MLNSRRAFARPLPLLDWMNRCYRRTRPGSPRLPKARGSYAPVSPEIPRTYKRSVIIINLACMATPSLMLVAPLTGKRARRNGGSDTARLIILLIADSHIGGFPDSCGMVGGQGCRTAPSSTAVIDGSVSQSVVAIGFYFTNRMHRQHRFRWSMQADQKVFDRAIERRIVLDMRYMPDSRQHVHARVRQQSRQA